MSKITCTKRFGPFPFAHRQHLHPGHCSLIHGHNWEFELEFNAHDRDACDFVVDFGNLGWIKDWMNDTFDHTLVLNAQDPMFDYLLKALWPGNAGSQNRLAKIIVVPSCSSEGLAHYLYDCLWTKVKDRTMDRAWLARVTVFEDNKNSATFVA